MENTYRDTIHEYMELYNKQDDEFKEAIHISSDICKDSSVKEIFAFINKEETSYNTYSHN